MRLVLITCTALVFGLSGCNEATKETAIDEASVSGPVIEVLKPEAIRAKLEEAQGTVTVVNFWATWCPPCVEETPELIDFYETHHGNGVTFLSISVDHPSTIEKAVVPFARKYGIPFPIFVVDEPDPGAISGKVGLELSGAVPVTWILDRGGKPVRSWLGEVTAADLEAAVKPLL